VRIDPHPSSVDNRLSATSTRPASAARPPRSTFTTVAAVSAFPGGTASSAFAHIPGFARIPSPHVEYQTALDHVRKPARSLNSDKYYCPVPTVATIAAVATVPTVAAVATVELLSPLLFPSSGIALRRR